MPDDNELLLNRNQKRSVEITLRRLEKLLGRIEREQDLPEEKGRLYRFYNSLQGEPEQARLLELAGEGRSQLKELADLFHLQPISENRLDLYRGELNVLWESLIEIESARLKGYGSVNPHLGALLDPPVRRLTQLVVQMETIASGYRI
ncbi:MAG TPA: hypothetical protein VH186_33940 [Chloroflexia bacterium]|nr:hypothetical protein [Chloroflexia bacterium]